MDVLGAVIAWLLLLGFVAAIGFAIWFFSEGGHARPRTAADPGPWTPSPNLRGLPARCPFWSQTTGARCEHGMGHKTTHDAPRAAVIRRRYEDATRDHLSRDGAPPE